MPAITSLGVGSGMDINSIVSQLVALQRRPIVQLQADANVLQTKVSSFGKMQSLFTALGDASRALSDTSLWGQMSVQSADPTAVQVASVSGAVAGSYAVGVQALARSQTVVATAALGASTEAVGAGTMTIQLGRWSDDTSQFFAKDGSSAIDIAVTASDTLGTLRDKINDAGAGVSASIVTDANGSRLSIRSTESGAENGFRVQVTDDDGNGTDAAGLSRFAYDPPGGATQVARTQAGTDAKATVNGIEITSASNKLSGVVEGLDITLMRETTDDVDVSLTQDKTAITDAIKAFAKAYSDLSTYIRGQTKYDPATKVAGTLQGDSTAVGMLSRLRSVLTAPSGASSVFSRLSDIGLQMKADGTLEVKQSKLDEALANPSELRLALSNVDEADASNNGFAVRYKELANAVTGSEGALTTRTGALRTLIERNEDRQDQMNDRAEQYRTRLLAQYTAMDANLARLNALSGFVSQQLTALSSLSKSISGSK